MTKRCVCECSEDVQAGFSFSVVTPSVVGLFVKGDGCVAKFNCGLCCVFAGLGCDECECGFSG